MVLLTEAISMEEYIDLVAFHFTLHLHCMLFDSIASLFSVPGQEAQISRYAKIFRRKPEKGCCQRHRYSLTILSWTSEQYSG